MLFFEALGEAVEECGLEVHAYALMPSHFHLLVRSVHRNPSRAMGRALASLTIRSNRANRPDRVGGPVFRGRFRNIDRVEIWSADVAEQWDRPLEIDLGGLGPGRRCPTCTCGSDQ